MAVATTAETTGATTAATTALIIAAHGDRGGPAPNLAIAQHCDRLRRMSDFGRVTAGFLNGTPRIEDVLASLKGRRDLKDVLVYPFFMSVGYFVDRVLPERIALAALAIPVRQMAPLGADPLLLDLMEERAIGGAAELGIPAEDADLLVVGHGSKLGPASANATKAVAAGLAERTPFATVTTAFLEEPPFVDEAIPAATKPLVVLGYFSSGGMHAAEDVPAAIARATVPLSYRGAIGADPAVATLIAASAMAALGLEAREPATLAHEKRDATS